VTKCNVDCFLRMKEIHLCWAPFSAPHADRELPDSGLWHPDNAENRRALQLVMEAVNDTHGKGTYWIEERDL
jgi:hypothetical protein